MASDATGSDHGATAPTAPAARSAKGRILVVDDNRLVLATLSDGLSRAGYDVIDADNGDDAILLAREHRPDLALLDIRMEGKSGFDVAAYLKAHAQMPFMFLSAFADEATAAQVEALGAVAYLVKPLDIGRIVPVVDAAFVDIAARAARRETPGDTPNETPNEAPGDRPTDRPNGARNDTLDATVAMAAGVLMHRYSLHRAAAVERVVALAAAEARTPREQAERLLDAVEQLAAPAPK